MELGFSTGLSSSSVSGTPFINTISTLFDGVDDQVDIGAASDFTHIHTTGIFTISVWAKLTDNTASDGFTYLGNNSGGNSNGFFFLWDNRGGFNKSVRMGITEGGSVIIDSKTADFAITDDDWHSIVVTGDGTNVFFYIDNVKETGSGTMGSKGTGNSFDNVQIGRLNNLGTLLFDGNIDEVSMWTNQFSDAQVTELYNLGVPTSLITHSAVSNLDGWWRMGDGDTFPTILDNSAQGRNGTMVNMAANDFVEDVI